MMKRGGRPLGRINSAGISRLIAVLDTLKMVIEQDIDDIDFLRSLIKSLIESQEESLKDEGYRDE